MAGLIWRRVEEKSYEETSRSRILVYLRGRREGSEGKLMKLSSR
jgi:hypothetical protein